MKKFVFGGIVLIGVLVAAFLVTTGGSDDEPTLVPNVVGTETMSAVQVLEDLDLRVSIEETQDAADGTVVAQSPEAGVTVAPGSAVTLTVGADRQVVVTTSSTTSTTTRPSTTTSSTTSTTTRPSTTTTP